MLFPVVFLALSSDTHSSLQLSEMANSLVKPVLQTAPGAADVSVFGERKFAMRIWVDPDKLAAYRLTVQDLEDALRRSNLEVPAGRIESRQREFNVTAATDLQRPQEFSPGCDPHREWSAGAHCRCGAGAAGPGG
jgi:multidrug efflux pump